MILHSDDDCKHSTSHSSSHEGCDVQLNKSIWTAALENDLSIIKKYFHKGKNLSVEDSCGYTALHHACRLNYFDIVEYLILKKADVNAKGCGATPLQRAAYAGHVKVCLYLLENGADIDLQDLSFCDQKTALHKALYQHHYKLSSFLLKYGAAIDIPDCNSVTANDLIASLPSPLPPILEIHKEKEMFDLNFNLTFKVMITGIL